MGDTLAKLKVILEASTASYKKEMKEAQKVSKNVSDSVQAETSKIKQAINAGNVTEPVKKQLSMMQKLKRSITDLQVKAGIKAPTEGYQEIQSSIKNAEKELSALIAKQEKFENSGKSKENLQWKNLIYDINHAQRSLKEYEAESERMKADGTAYKQVPTAEYKKVKDAIAAVNAQLQKYDEKGDKLEATGVKKDSRQWRSLIYDIEQARGKLWEYEEKAKALETSGKATHQIPTEEYQKVQSKIADVNKELGKYQEKEKKLQALGVSKESSEWRKLKNDISRTSDTVKDYKAQANQMVSDGTAFKRPYSIPKEMLKGVFLSLPKLGISAVAKGYGGLFKVVGTVASAFSKFNTVIKRTSGAFAALIQKFTSGIPILRRFAGSQNSVNGGLGNGLKTVLKYAFGIRSLFVLVNKIRSAAVEGFQNLAQYSGETNNSISLLMSSLTQLKNSIAAAFAPVLNVVAPILNALIQKVISVFNVIGQLTSALTGNTTFIKAKKVQQDYAKSLNNNANSAKNAKKANEELQRTILSFDQINKMDDNSSSDSNSGIADTGGGLSPSDMFETQSIPSKIKGIADLIKQAWKNADFTDIGALVGNKLNSALNSIPWNKIQNTCNKIAKSVATFLNGFIETTDWGLVGNTLAKGINTAFGTAKTFAENFHWKSLGDAVGNGINGALGGLDWYLIQGTVHSVASGIVEGLNAAISTTDWGLVGQTIGEYFNTKLEAFYTVVHNFDWGGVGQAIADSLNGVFETFDFAKAGKSISDVVRGILNTFITAIENTKWTLIGEKIAQFLDNIDWAGIAGDLVAVLSAALAAALGLLSGFIGQLVVDGVHGAQRYFADAINDCGGNIALGILKGIGGIFVNIGTWIYDNVFKPFITTFKNCFGIHSPSTVMAEQGGYIIDGLLKGVKDNISKFLSYVAEIPGKVLKSIGNIKNKVLSKGSDIISGLREGFTDKVSSFTDLLGSLPETIRNAIPDLFDVGASIIQNFANGFSSIHIPLPHISATWNHHQVGPVGFSTPSFSLQWYAKGGFPEAGQLFVANEAGPEMVGKMGNRNVVANNNQIIEGIKNGVFEAVLDAFNASGLLDRDDSEKEVVLEFTLKADSETLYKVVRKGKKKYDYRFAVTETI